MAKKAVLQVYRGIERDIGVLKEGELGYCIDTQKLYIGTSAGNVLLVDAQTAGDMLKNIYDTNNDGVIDVADIAKTINGFTVGVTVPANAKFTDTVYSHPNSGATAGIYRSVTVNAQGHVTGGTNPTTLAGYGITDGATKIDPTFDGQFTFGYRRSISTENNFCAGSNLDVSGPDAAAFGTDCFASGNHSFAIGWEARATGNGAMATGLATTASGDYSHTEGYETKAKGDYSHAEGYYTYAVGVNSHAEGSDCYANGENSHAEGYNGNANGEASHVEGCDGTANGNYSHVEGNYCDTSINADSSHAEGDGSSAYGYASHAEGNSTQAIGTGSHSQGGYTAARADYSFTSGYDTEATNYASTAIGKYSNAMTTGASSYISTGDSFVIGNGYYVNSTKNTVKSNAFRITYSGVVYSKGAYNTTGADYAEYFEWEDGNPSNEDRRGYFVTTVGEKIKIADSTSDYIIGIVSANPCIIGNSDEDWSHRWVKDEFGSYIIEEVEEEEYVNVLNRETRQSELVKSGDVIKGKRYKMNPDYNPELGYVERKDRKEWTAIGMMGVLSVRDNGECKVNSFCTVGEGGIAVPSSSGYRVIGRVIENIIKVVFK